MLEHDDQMTGGYFESHLYYGPGMESTDLNTDENQAVIPSNTLFCLI